MSCRDIRQIYFYEFRLGTKAAETARKINEVWGHGTVNQSTVRRWYQKFRNGDLSLEEEERIGRPSKLDNKELKALVEKDTRTTIRKLATNLDVSIGTVCSHMKQIGKKKKLETLVPHELTIKNKMQRFDICSEHIFRMKNEPFLHRLITCDEKWLLYNNNKRSAQWLDIHESPKSFPKPSQHEKKVMVTVWWCSKGVIHYDFLEKGEMITAEKYCQEIDVMQEKLKKMYPALINRKGPILLHDNARPHIAKQTMDKLKSLNYEIMKHPPYSPDLSPTDFHLFKHLQNYLNGKRFENEGVLKKEFEQFLASRSTEFYRIGMENLPIRWQKCVNANGFYFN
ncbi:IS630 transposase-related protein [Sphingomonas sp. IW22]|uniref:IS630 transposase-related protein n=1 Tax=Sphingomonas sp. IW22 TaxID=3242489 RepID=UPI003521E746